MDNVVGEAVDAWLQADLNDAQQRALRNLDVRLMGLQGETLGFASPSTGRVFIDRDGAGQGYGVGAYDLLSVVTHEIGHILGYDDTYDAGLQHDVMHGILEPGQTRLPVSSLRSEVVGASSLLNNGLWVSDRLLDDLARDREVERWDAKRTDLRLVAEVDAVDHGATGASDELEMLFATSQRRRRDEVTVDLVFAELEEEQDGEEQ